MTSGTRRFTVGALTAMLIGLPMCDEALSPVPTCVDGSSGAPVQYVLTWNTTGATTTEDGLGRLLTNDLGYTIELRTAYIVSLSAQLIECPGAQENTTAWRSPGLGSRVALAGHADPSDSGSATQSSIAENVLEAAEHTLDTVCAPPTRYCSVHYLVARAETQTQALPETTDLSEQSMVFVGESWTETDPEPRPFQVHSSLANGTITDLVDANGAMVEVDASQSSATVVIERALGTIFDGIDFANMDEDAMALQLTRNVIDQTQIQVALR